jgi:hypothetical protein
MGEGECDLFILSKAVFSRMTKETPSMHLLVVNVQSKNTNMKSSRNSSGMASSFGESDERN